MLALAALAVAMAVKVNDSNTDRALVPTLVICAALAFVGIGRPAYIPLAATPLLLSTLPLRWRVVGTSAIAVSVLVWSALVSFTSLINTEGHRGVYPLQQLELLFVSPGRIVNLAFHVLTQQQGMEGLPFYKEFIGVLGWIDVVLPSWFYPCAVVALSLAILVCAFDGEPLLRPVARLGLCVLLCLSVILIFLLEYLTWTPVGFPVVEGVQGRYFLPLAMFATALAPTRRLQIVSRCCHMVEVFLLLFPALSISVTIATVVRRYYL